ncbi:EAL domain-containing protein [Thermodesulfobacterium hydrogeniphilum]|uniref:EAL domain-containing protein n=1 Tax=Thermodesulfobacterium hydrogeniphilum TaxID=161156 RepID=UPI00056F5376|nr:EAL domain-containing protein [Thermodesulfobacterium hydrogeniphilum]
MNKIEEFLKKEEFLKTLNEYINSFSRENIFLIYLDINDFFLINVNYGFEVGDLVLKDFANYLRKSFENFDILWGWLSNDQFILAVFEITENSLVNFLDAFQLLDEELKNKKIKLAIDDFEAGYASFSFLLKIKADFLKIDGVLISQINKSFKYRSVIKGIVFLAKELGLKTIAEFVKTKDEIEILKNLGIDYLQGFFLSRPLSYEEFKKVVN